MAGVYYTKTTEEDNKFHIYAICSEGQNILEENKERAAAGRTLCEVCAKLVPKA